MTAIAELTPAADEERRRELAGFLRSRRERITPEQVGLPVTGRRRTPGLRREEVAQLAGVGVTWYTWLEQGRDIRASEQVLAAIAGTLRLDLHERGHLFALAGVPEPPAELNCRAVPPGVLAMMERLHPFPAAVYNARTDVLAHNRAYQWLFDIESVPFADRNATLLRYTNPAWQARLPDWLSDGMSRSAGALRAAMAEHVDDPGLKDLVARLRRESPEFDREWRRHEVQPITGLVKRVLHPEAGMLLFDCTHLWLGRRSENRLSTMVPADDATRAVMAAL
ncbi:helix-turn-helix transcriptional regulator [Pseudonocardia sp. CA-107938]|uniref:helix-turn-helix transcriptional regulator n=1 Tax=Pseudonocardia sp. CA-107938 TaxID=3240021 RepID=UPI003D904F41